jgi:DNA-binding response OmpR family regulator
MKKILIVEDDGDINNMLCDLLEQNGYIPVPAYSGTEAIMRFANQNEKYDLVLLDLMLPGKAGIDVLAEIKEIKAIGSVPVIALTAVSDKDSIVSLLKSGANDYITKPFDNAELLARIEVQFRNNEVADKRQLIFKDIELNSERYDGFINQQPLQLSKREFEILALLMQNPKKVFTKNNLYESVWQDEFLGDDNTINVHISKIRAKIAKIKPGEEYIQTVWGIGFKMQE